MRRARTIRTCAWVMITSALGILSMASNTLATKYAGEPYDLGVGGRALGRGGAFVASTPDASSVFWNIASLAALTRPEAMAQHAGTFGSLLNHDFIAVAFPAREESGWAWGAYGTYLGGSGIQLTALDTLRGRPVVTGEASHADWSLVFGLARKTPRWWSWGVAVKTVVRNLPGNSAFGLGLDAAWWGQGRGWRAGVKVADVTTTFLSYDSGRNETIIPHINFGGEVELPQAVEGLTSLFSVESETYFEGRTTGAQYWSGSVSVDLHLGFEAIYRNVLSGRVGSDAGRLALGAGFNLERWGIDAALTDHKFLDRTYRISIRYIIR